jgi:hypothetical protein
VPRLSSSGSGGCPRDTPSPSVRAAATMRRTGSTSQRAPHQANSAMSAMRMA